MKPPASQPRSTPLPSGVAEALPGAAASELLAAIVESSEDAILSKTLDGVVTTWNRAAECIYGYTADEIVGRSFEVLVPPERVAEVRHLHARIGRGERVERFEMVRRRKDGSEVDVSLTLSPIRDGRGRVVGISAITRDVTAARRAEAAIREQARTLETINRINAYLAAELDLEKLVQAVTDAGTELTGALFGAFFYNVDDGAGGHYLLYTLSGESREELSRLPMPRNTALFGATFRGEGVIRLADVTADPRYGRNAPYDGMPPGHPPVRSYLAVPVMSRSDQVLGGLFFGHPEPDRFSEHDEALVTGIAVQAAIALGNARLFEEARRQAEQLAEADRRKDEFLALLGHELRNPLGAMTSALSVMEAAAGEASGDGPLSILRRQTRRMARLVNDLLDVARISRGRIALQPARVDLAEAVRHAADSVRPQAETAGVGLEVVVGDEPIAIEADAVRLEQILVNLLGNAIKYSLAGGRVRIAASCEAAQAVVRVADEGVGIAPALLPRIFDLFTQGPQAPASAPSGLGIGLTLVQQLVVQHGGEIAAESPGVGRGSTFTVRLPALPPGSKLDDSGIGERPPASSTGSRRRLLLVDDNADAAEALGSLLTLWGHRVEIVHDGEAALSSVALRRPEVVVLDLGLPGLDGWEVARRLRAGAGGDRLTLVALTGYGRHADRERSADAGFDLHLVKPVDPAELRELLDRLP